CPSWCRQVRRSDRRRSRARPRPPPSPRPGPVLPRTRSSPSRPPRRTRRPP
ncbi:MAG: 2-oxoglutarate dehydrogenase E2, partial [Propionibacteriaceae bacterium]